MQKMKLIITKAKAEDTTEMTKLIIAAKRYWGYPDEWMQLWMDELTITQAKLDKRDFYLGKNGDEIIYIYAISLMDGDEYELEDCWVAPSYIGHGFGRLLFDDLKKRLHALGCSRLIIISDPNAEGFYRKMGAVKIGEKPTRIEGRSFSIFEFRIINSK